MFITKSDEFIVHPVLTELAIAYPQTGLVAGKIAPMVDVGEGNEDGYFFVYDKINLQGGIEDVRTFGARANTYDWKTTKDSYHCEQHVLEKPIDWREFKKWKKYLDLAKKTQEKTLELLLTNYEIAVATLFTTTANYASGTYYSTLSGTSQWSDFANSDPEANVETAREVVAIGAAEPNSIIMPVSVWRTARRHPAIRSLIQDTNSAQLTEDGFPKNLFGLDAYYPGGRKITTMPGATESISRIWSDYVWVGVINANPAIDTLAFAYTIQTETIKTTVYEDKPSESDVVKVQHRIASEKIVCNTAGYLYSDVLA